jgi:methyl-accepting chemotaxis protein
MTMPSNTNFWNRLSVGQKIATIPLLFSLGLAGILGYTVWVARGQQSDAYRVFIAARQRMLVQRQLAQALLVSQGVTVGRDTSRAATIQDQRQCTKNADYLATRQIAQDSLVALKTGGEILDLKTEQLSRLSAVESTAAMGMLVDQEAALSALNASVDKAVKLKEADAEYAAARDELLVASSNAEQAALNLAKLLSDEAQAKVTSLIVSESLVSLLVVAVAVAFSFLVTRGIVTPLGGAAELAREISNGNLKVQKLTAASRDEVGQLTAASNQMLDSLRDLAGQTATVTANINAAAAEILASTQQQAASTKEQAATVQEITTTMEEVRQSGAQITERAKTVATAAEASSATTQAGLAAVQETNRSMEAIRTQVEEVAEKIVALSEKTQAVGEIIATVNDIAERSNLLALNAAIEAAGAGEHGNRFSVVAGEIKNLADQAKESTVQVRTILGDIQKGINSSVMLTEEAVKRADTGKQQADVTEQTIRRMADTTQESVQAFQQIIGATSQQQIGFEQVTQGMQDIRQAASQTAAGTVQLEKAVANLNTQSLQLREAVGRYQL